MRHFTFLATSRLVEDCPDDHHGLGFEDVFSVVYAPSVKDEVKEEPPADGLSLHYIDY